MVLNKKKGIKVALYTVNHTQLRNSVANSVPILAKLQHQTSNLTVKSIKVLTDRHSDYDLFRLYPYQLQR